MDPLIETLAAGIAIQSLGGYCEHPIRRIEHLLGRSLDSLECQQAMMVVSETEQKVDDYSSEYANEQVAEQAEGRANELLREYLEGQEQENREEREHEIQRRANEMAVEIIKDHQARIGSSPKPSLRLVWSRPKASSQPTAAREPGPFAGIPSA